MQSDAIVQALVALLATTAPLEDEMARQATLVQHPAVNASIKQFRAANDDFHQEASRFVKLIRKDKIKEQDAYQLILKYHVQANKLDDLGKMVLDTPYTGFDTDGYRQKTVSVHQQYPQAAQFYPLFLDYVREREMKIDVSEVQERSFKY